MSLSSDGETRNRPSRRWLVPATAALAVAIAVVVVVIVRSGSGASDEAGLSEQAGISDQAAESSRADRSSAQSAASASAVEAAASVSYMDKVPVTVESRSTEAPVPLTSAAAVPGMQVRLKSIEAVEGQALVAGEVSGPALRITVDLENSSESDFDSSMVVVNAFYGADRIPAGGLLNPGAQPFPPTVAPGESVSGIFVFSVPVDERGLVRTEVDLAVDLPVVIFEGAVG